MLSLRIVDNPAQIGAVELLVISKNGATRVVVEERDIAEPEISLELHQHYTLDLRMGADGLIETPMAVLSCLWRGQQRPIRGVVKWLSGGVSIAVPFGFLT